MNRAVTALSQRNCRRGRFAPLASVLLLLTASVPANPDVTITRANGLVSVSAIDATPRTVLNALISEGLLDDSALAVLDEPVTLGAGTLVRRALRHESYVLWEQGRSQYLLVFRPVDAAGPVHDRVSESPNMQLDQIRRQLTNVDPEIRQWAVLDVVGLDTSLAVDLLAPATLDPDPAVREAAAAVLEDLGATDWVASQRLKE